MGRLSRFGASLLCLCTFICEADAQNPTMVPANLKFTQEISTRFHTVVWVTLQMHDGSIEKFQYDRYPKNGLHPGAERIKKTAGVFARSSGKSWMRSDDWGDAGSAVSESMKRELDSDVNIVAIPFRPPTHRDSTQGMDVWRYTGSIPHGPVTDVTFEESREHPKPDVHYPIYTFMKASGDTDGRLFLSTVVANMRDDAGIIPLTMRMTYLVPVPAGAKVQVYDKDTGKEKLNTVTGPDSGWEITTQTSEPPVIKPK